MLTKISEIFWGTSQQDRLTSIIGGTDLHEKLETKTTIQLKFSKWNSHKCKMTLITSREQLTAKKEPNYEINPGRIEVKRMWAIRIKRPEQSKITTTSPMPKLRMLRITHIFDLSVIKTHFKLRATCVRLITRH